MTFSRDEYISLLEKRAADPDSPNYSIDSSDVADKEHESNRSDNRSELKGLFAQAGNVEKGNTKTMDKLLPHKPRETSNILMKVAAAAAELPFFKHASPAFLQVAMLSFDRELQKIAMDPNSAIHGLFNQAAKARKAIPVPSMAQQLASHATEAAKKRAMPAISQLAGR